MYVEWTGLIASLMPLNLSSIPVIAETHTQIAGVYLALVQVLES